MANMNFGVNILPKANNTYSIGNSDYKWNIYANTINGTSPSSYYIKPVGGIPSTDLAETYLTQHQDISGKANSADLATVATTGAYSDLSGTPTTMTGASSSAAGATGLVPAPAAGDENKFLAGDGTYKDGGQPMVVLSYGNSSWTDFINAYNNNIIVYCRASSGSNPASGNQTRMAFMAYVNSTPPTEVEFQYYRSMSSHSATQLGDQVFIYKLTNKNVWSVTTRDASVKEIIAGTNIGVSYSSNKVTINNTLSYSDATTSASGLMSAADKTTVDTLDSILTGNDLYSTVTDTPIAHITSSVGGVKIKDLVFDCIPADQFTGSDHIIFNVTGKNLLNITSIYKAQGIYAAGGHSGITNGRIDENSIGSGSSDYLICSQLFPPGTYTFSCKYSGAVSLVRILTSNPIQGGSYNSYYGGYYLNTDNGTVTFTCETDFGFGLALVPVTGQEGEPGLVYDIQLERSSTATEYEKYCGKIYTISLDETLHRGEFNPISGILKITHGYIESYAGETLAGAWISDSDEYEEGTSPSTGAQVVYELATPIETSLGSMDIKQFQGDTYIWSNYIIKQLEYANDNTQLLDSAERAKIAQDVVTDVRVNDTSLVQDGIVNLPHATMTSLGLTLAGGLGVATNNNSGEIYTVKADDTQIKNASSNYAVIVPATQHKSTFYGLAKAAGDTTQSESSNEVGVYTSYAKAAIQQMLGLYKKKWELIKEETFTTTEAEDYIITTDSSNNSFQLTDVMMLVELPQLTEGDVASSKGYYGHVWFYYDASHSINIEAGAFSRSAGGAATGAWYCIRNDDDFITSECTQPTTNTNSGYVKRRFLTFTNNNANPGMGIGIFNDFAIEKINIKQVTGNCHYKLYGRRK